ncbi:MAG: metal-dependent hydrolase [Hadesarchaea archaeon]|nr:metal-dependent hydrolase [Hadesarchaea archaeon]
MDDHIKWLGHSAFEISIDNKIMLIDPFLTGNPKATIKASEIQRVDIVCVTHDHHDHLGDSIELCRRLKATFVGIYELGVYAQREGIDDVVAMNIGATVQVKGFKISMVPAFHSANRGAPVGFVVESGGIKIYHAGDTALFGDMQMIGRIYSPDVALLPIGGYYTMGPVEAVEAARFISPKVVIPMHYLTFPVLEQSAERFVRLLEDRVPHVRAVVLKPGEIYEYPKNQDF